MPQILLSDLAVEQLTALPAAVGRPLLDSLQRLRLFPHSAPLLMLEGYDDYRQLIVQSHRAIYQYDETKDIVCIYCILHTRRRLPSVEFLIHQQF